MRDEGKDGFRWIDPNDLYMGLFLVALLVAGWLGKSEYTAEKIVQEKKAEACKRATENAQRFAFALAHVLNGGNLKTDETLVSCRQIQRSS